MEMTEQNSGYKFENTIMVENLSKSLSDNERKKIEDMLHSNNIHIGFYETGPQASLFDAITIFFNEPLTKMIITGLLTSGTYDVIKFVVSCFLSKLKNAFLIKFDSKEGVVKKNIPQLNLHLRTGNAEINILVSDNLSHEQMLEYMDKARKTIIELEKTKIRNLKNHETFVIVSYDDKSELVKVMTIVQYAKEQQKKNQKSSTE
jgi:hypothetical protein